jgi:hypothetical protein
MMVVAAGWIVNLLQKTVERFLISPWKTNCQCQSVGFRQAPNRSQIQFAYGARNMIAQNLSFGRKALIHFCQYHDRQQNEQGTH